MESQLEDCIRAFLTVSSGSGDGSGYGSGDGSGYGDGDGYGYGYGSGDGDGYGDGSGDGSGYGSGDGYGYGDGDGDGYGDGSGDGYGYGSGDGYGYGDGDGSGDGITEFNGKRVWKIDGVATIIESVHNSYAIGSILNVDFTLIPCYIAKVGNWFAHGDTLRKAFGDANLKALKNTPVEERIARFKEEFPDADKKIPARRLWEWHHTLTGSCEAGRNQFAREHNISINTDTFTVREFIKLTCKSYGSDVIIKLGKAYNVK